MDVLELSVKVDAEGAEAIAAVFNEYAYGGAVIEQTVTPDPGETLDPARPFTVRAFLLADQTANEKRSELEQAVWHIGQMRPLGELNVRELKETDWSNAWKKFYAILHVGERTVIKPSWLEYTARPGEVLLELDPGMAFGTGLHPTTRMCLAAVEKYLVPGMTLLDVGTGSGILAIAGAKLGASRVEARDIDPIAVDTAIKNVALNRVQDVVSVIEGSISPGDTSLEAGIITANILAETIADMAPALARHLQSKGILIASGILTDKTSLVGEALDRVGIRTVDTMREDDWLVMVGGK